MRKQKRWMVDGGWWMELLARPVLMFFRWLYGLSGRHKAENQKPPAERCAVICNGHTFIYVWNRGEWEKLLDHIAAQVAGQILCPGCGAALVATQAKMGGMPVKEFLELSKRLEAKLAEKFAAMKEEKTS